MTAEHRGRFAASLALGAVVLAAAPLCAQDEPGAHERITPAPTAPDDTTSPQAARRTIDAAVAYLLRTQNADGSWGGSMEPAIGFDEFWSNPETHRAWTIATTGLVAMALLELEPAAATDTAYERAVGYLLETGMIKRPSEWDTDNTWALVYAVQSLARAWDDGRFRGTEREAPLKALGQAYIDKLFTYQSPDGGWGYYDFEVHARRPAWSTSFMTAAAVLALLDARDAGFDVDEKRFNGAVRAVERCRLPNGAFSYSVGAVPSPGRMEGIDQVKGSLCRIQVCNIALLRAGRDVEPTALRAGLDQFFEHHRFLDIARKKPVPHEAYYANSGYFYFFGHFYAALVIDALPEEEQAAYWPKLRHEIVKTQEADGSMWDYYMNSYHRPYGVAFSLLGLRPSLR